MNVLSVILSVIMMFTIVFPNGVFAEEFVVEDNDQAAEEFLPDGSGESQLDEEIIAAEEAARLAAEQAAAEEAARLAAEQAAAEEAARLAAEQAAAEEAARLEEEQVPFIQGYVLVKRDTILYATESKQEEQQQGFFSDDAIVYAKVSTRAEDEAYSWLWIVVDTDEAKKANERIRSRRH